MAMDYTNYFNRSIRRSMQSSEKLQPLLSKESSDTSVPSSDVAETSVVPEVQASTDIQKAVDSPPIVTEPVAKEESTFVQEQSEESDVRQPRRPVTSVDTPVTKEPATDVLDDMDKAVRMRQQSVRPLESSTAQGSSSGVSARLTPSKARGPRTRGETVQLRDFPASLVNLAQGEFPNESMSRALAAYLIVHSDIDLTQESVSDDIATLVKTHRKSREQVTTEAIYTRLTGLERQLSNLIMQNRELELALAYVIFDRLGYRQNSAGEPSKVDLLEDGVMDMVDRLRAEAANARNQDTLRHGRTIR